MMTPPAAPASAGATAQHWRVLGLCSALFALVLLFEFGLSLGVPEATFIVLVEVLSSVVAVFFLVRRLRAPAHTGERRIAAWLIAFFVFGGFADGSYAYHYYFLRADNQAPDTVLLTTFPYVLSYLCAFLAIWTCFARGNRRFWARKLSAIPLGLSIPFLLNILVPSLDLGVRTYGWGPFVWGRLASFASSFLLFNVGILAVLSSRSLFWAFFSAGAVQLVIVNWSLTAQRFLGLPYEFGFYECVWAFGKLLTLASVIVWNRADFAPQKFEKNSLIGQTRVAIFVGVTSLLIAIHLFAPLNIYAIEFITLIFLIGTLSSILAGQLLSEKVTFFAERLGAAVSASHTSDLSPESLADYPVELRECYERVFAKQIEVERRNVQLEIRLGSELRQVAHDIRSPVTALEVAIADPDDFGPEKRRLVLSAVKRIKEIASDLLANKLENDVKGPLEPVAIGPLVEELVAEKRASANRKSIAIRTCGTADGTAIVCVDAEKLKRVLSNLFDNSVDAIEAEGHVEVQVSQRDRWVEIALSDDGKGIAPEDLDRVFRKGVTIGKVGGNGIGLHYAKQHVTGWGGSVRIDSRPRVGTRVIVSLPSATH